MINIGVIGLGMGRAHLEGYAATSQARIVGVADIDEERLSSCAATYDVPKTFTDYRDLLAIPELDAVSIAVPNDLHAPVTIAALRAGKHVLVEKPMAKTCAEAESMLAAGRETYTALMTDTDVDDLASALVRLKGGATIALESTWESHTRPGFGLTVLGTEGGAILDPGAAAGSRLTLFGTEGDNLTEITPVDIRLSREASIQEHFIDCLLDGRQPETSAERGLAVMRIIEAVYSSSAGGREIEIAK